MSLSLSQMSSGWRETANRVILAPDVGRLQIALVPLSGADQALNSISRKGIAVTQTHDHQHEPKWKYDSVRVLPGSSRDPNTPQTPGMDRKAAINKLCPRRRTKNLCGIRRD